MLRFKPLLRKRVMLLPVFIGAFSVLLISNSSVSARPTKSGDLSPSSATVTVPAGSTGTEAKVVGVPAKPPKCDIELAFDTTGSMSDALSQAQKDAANIVNGVQASVPDCLFAVVGFKDSPPASTGDPYEYKLFLATSMS